MLTETKPSSRRILVVNPAEGGVVDDCLGSRNVRRKALEAGDGDRGFGARVGYPVEVQDEPANRRACCHHDELGAPSGLSAALEVKGRVAS